MKDIRREVGVAAGQVAGSVAQPVAPGT
jgi:hypothetical protein